MSPEALDWVYSLLTKATLLLGAAAMAATALRHRSASARHAIWSVALLGVLVLPPLSALLPRWELPLLPATSPAPVVAVPRADPAAGRSAVLESASPRRALATGAPLDPAGTPAPPARIGRHHHWSEWLLLLWSVGAAVGLARVAAGAWVAGRLARHAVPVDDPEWTALVAEVSHTFGRSRVVDVRESADVALPMVWGYRRPRVLLPPDAALWPVARKRAFLLHELAHVERHDCLIQTLASIAQALYWPHPLVWWSMRRLRREAEHACDDRVLAAGTRGPEYADHLLDIARSLQHARPPIVAMGIAERSNLEDRLLALLDPHLRRGRIGRRAVATGALLGLAVVGTVAALQPVARAAVAQAIAAVTAPPPRAEASVVHPAPAAAIEDVRAPARAVAPAAPAARRPEVAIETEREWPAPEPMREARAAAPAEVEAAAPPSTPEPAPAVVVRLGVDLVQLDAVVTDRDGGQVTDLSAADFEVLEDGQPQKVTHARYVVADAAAAAGDAATSDDVRRVITVVVDDLGLSFAGMSHLRDGLRKLVQERIGPHDRVAVVTTGKPVGLRQALTSDRAQLTAAVDALRYNSWNRGAAALTGGAGQRQPTRRRAYTADDGIPVSGGFATGGNPSLIRHVARKTLGAIEDYVVEMRDLPGRKSVLLFSDQISLRDPLAPARRGEVWIDSDMVDGIQRITDAASRSAVVIYGVGSGVVPTLDAAERGSAARDVASARRSAFNRRHSDLDGVARLADATGGFLFYGGQHVDSVLDVILEDLRGYYLLGYTPSDAAFRPNKQGKREYHEIEVRVLRRGTKVRSRTGFYGVTDEEEMPARRSDGGE